LRCSRLNGRASDPEDGGGRSGVDLENPDELVEGHAVGEPVEQLLNGQAPRKQGVPLIRPGSTQTASSSVIAVSGWDRANVFMMLDEATGTWAGVNCGRGDYAWGFPPCAEAALGERKALADRASLGARDVEIRVLTALIASLRSQVFQLASRNLVIDARAAGHDAVRGKCDERLHAAASGQVSNRSSTTVHAAREAVNMLSLGSCPGSLSRQPAGTHACSPLSQGVREPQTVQKAHSKWVSGIRYPATFSRPASQRNPPRRARGTV